MCSLVSGVIYVHSQDTLIPMMMDSRYPVDTLWFILEEDYRFFPEDQDPDFADRYKSRAAKLGEEREREREHTTTRERAGDRLGRHLLDLEPTARIQEERGKGSHASKQSGTAHVFAAPQSLVWRTRASPRTWLTSFG